MKTLGFVAVSLVPLVACDSNGIADAFDAAPMDATRTQEGGIAALSDASVGSDAAVMACNPQITKHALLSSPHISPNQFDPSAYNSNPPSSGPHCGLWGQHATFVETPLPRCNYIHNLEHGAVALLYNCPGGCADVPVAFASLVQAFKGDPGCRPARFVITPDAALTTKVAAAAWGWTFTADCLDANATQALSQFVDAHYGAGFEDVCPGGQVRP